MSPIAIQTQIYNYSNKWSTIYIQSICNRWCLEAKWLRSFITEQKSHSRGFSPQCTPQWLKFPDNYTLFHMSGLSSTKMRSSNCMTDKLLKLTTNTLFCHKVLTSTFLCIAWSASRLIHRSITITSSILWSRISTCPASASCLSATSTILIANSPRTPPTPTTITSNHYK